MAAERGRERTQLCEPFHVTVDVCINSQSKEGETAGLRGLTFQSARERQLKSLCSNSHVPGPIVSHLKKVCE